MLKVKVNDRLGETASIHPHSNGCFPVWFVGQTSPEFFKKEDVEFLHNSMQETKPWTFCETPEEKCTMNYCDDNGCLNRKRNLVDPTESLESA